MEENYREINLRSQEPGERISKTIFRDKKMYKIETKNNNIDR